MQDFYCAIDFLYHIEVYATTWQNGVMQISDPGLKKSYSVHNVIECIFGVLKHWFRILLLAPEYLLEIQAQIPAALCAVHNFIWVHDSNKGEHLSGPEFSDDNFCHAGEVYSAENQPLHGQNSSPATLHHDAIAQAMWDHYLQVCSDGIVRGEEVEDEYLDGSDFVDDYLTGDEGELSDIEWIM